MALHFPLEVLRMIFEQSVNVLHIIDLCHDLNALHTLIRSFYVNRYIWNERNKIIWPNILVIERIFNEFPMLLALPSRHLQHIQRVELRLLKMPGPIKGTHLLDLPHVLQTMNTAMPKLRVLEVVIPGCEGIQTWGRVYSNILHVMVLDRTALIFNKYLRQNVKIFLRLEFKYRDDEHPNGPSDVNEIAEALLSYPPGKVELVRS